MTEHSMARKSQQELHDAISASSQITRDIARLIIEDVTTLLAKERVWLLDQFGQQDDRRREMGAAIQAQLDTRLDAYGKEIDALAARFAAYTDPLPAAERDQLVALLHSHDHLIDELRQMIVSQSAQADERQTHMLTMLETMQASVRALQSRPPCMHPDLSRADLESQAAGDGE